MSSDDVEPGVGERPEPTAAAAAAVAKAQAAARRATARARAERAQQEASAPRDDAEIVRGQTSTWDGSAVVVRDDDALEPPGTVRDVVELPAPAQVAREALNRAKAAARERGMRPGMPRKRADFTVRSGPGRDGRDPQLFGSTMSALLRERGWEEDVSVGGAIGRWREVVGDEIADHSTPEHFEDHVLHVRASSTAWATQLKLLTPQLLMRLAAELGEGVVSEVRVQGPVGRSFSRGQRSVKGRGPRDTWG